MTEPLWRPSPAKIKSSNLAQFTAQISSQCGVDLGDVTVDSVATYNALHEWSLQKTHEFWSAVWDYSGVVSSNKGDVTIVDADKMPGAKWFPQAKLNYAENLLQKSGSEPAIIFRGEQGADREMSWDTLRSETAALATVLKEGGVSPGDRVAGVMPNIPETIVAMLACASIGAIWSSCSPDFDFGVKGIVDRFGQIAPKVLFVCDGYFYNGKYHDCAEKIQETLSLLPTVELLVPVSMRAPVVEHKVGCSVKPYRDIVDNATAPNLVFAQLPFEHPLYIMYSSGTTGVPKCIVHSAGGTLLKHLSEHQLHCNLTERDRLFYFTTCGWMMWNWLVSGLASGATIMLFDGSPFYPDGNLLFDYIDDNNITIFGTSAKYIDALNKAGLAPIKTHRLSSVHSILSTGSPLSPESFDFVYQSIKQDVCLSSVSGGTDIIGCFVGGNPVLPVYRGEVQCSMLGMSIEVFDDNGKAVTQEKGELVCTKVFPSMPIGFWNDEDRSRYSKAYFEKYPNIWCHGDFVEKTEHGGLVFYGRSDAVLNPGGVRIGTAEIYRQVEELDEVVESLVIGQNWDSDVRVVLFVKLRESVELDDALQNKIKKKIRDNCTPRHVPAVILSVSDIPRTKSGKIVELAVRQVVHGEQVKNLEALANPEALEQFKNRKELA